jgi:hypothetical protein
MWFKLSVYVSTPFHTCQTCLSDVPIRDFDRAQCVCGLHTVMHPDRLWMVHRNQPFVDSVGATVIMMTRFYKEVLRKITQGRSDLVCFTSSDGALLSLISAASSVCQPNMFLAFYLVRESVESTRTSLSQWPDGWSTKCYTSIHWAISFYPLLQRFVTHGTQSITDWQGYRRHFNLGLWRPAAGCSCRRAVLQ